MCIIALLAWSNPPWGRRLRRAGAPIKLALPAAPPADTNNNNHNKLIITTVIQQYLQVEEQNDGLNSEPRELSYIHKYILGTFGKFKKALGQTDKKIEFQKKQEPGEGVCVCV